MHLREVRELREVLGAARAGQAKMRYPRLRCLVIPVALAHAPVHARRVVEKASSREKATMPLATKA
jgi:hypothetical protein